MRWPWLSRAAHDAIVAAKDAELERTRVDLIACRAAHDAFVLEVAERTRPAPQPERPQPVRREPDEVDTAIEWAAMGDPMRRRHLESFAKAERRKQTEAKTIAQMILGAMQPKDDAESLE